MLPKVGSWRGPVFIAVTSSMVLWLFGSGQLSLYIHPRYHLFTAAMAAIAVTATLLGLFFAIRRRARRNGANPSDHQHDHEHDDEDVPTTVAGKTAFWASTLLGAATVVWLVIVPPATLGSVTVDNRAINQSGLGDTQAALDAANQADQSSFAAFTVREWAGILRQTQDPAFFRGKPVDVIGFVAADPDNPEVFYVTRFVVSCCSVDAQPVGIPVALSDWESSWPTESWVRVTGEFSVNPDVNQSHPLVVTPESVEQTEQPSEPYLF